MIKRQNRERYILIILFGILELSTIVSAYAANYFTKTRMGMLRHVVYLNGKWEKTLPIPTIKWFSIYLIIIIVIFAVLRYYKKDVNSKVNMVTISLTVAISGWTVYFMLTQNTVKNRLYYILSMCYILITIFQNLLYHCIFSIKSENQLRRM